MAEGLQVHGKSAPSNWEHVRHDTVRFVAVITTIDVLLKYSRNDFDATVAGKLSWPT
jgi:hypothetical protein